jgi:DNA-binding MarR family transcriptional regulator
MFDSLLHQKIRSKLVSYLIKNEELPFIALAEMLDVTNGNLSSHLSKLEKAKYVKIEKFFEGKKTKTVVSITQIGRDAFKDYIYKLKEFVDNSLKDNHEY